MLENTNDYLSIVIIIAVIVGMLALALYVENLNVIRRNLRKEIKYYGYEKNKDAD